MTGGARLPREAGRHPATARIVTAGGITSGMEMGFHRARRAGWDEPAIAEVARVMEYSSAYDLCRDDRETAGASI